MRKRIATFLIILVFFIGVKQSFCQRIDSTTFRLNSRFSFYSSGEKAEMLLHVPAVLQHSFLNLRLKVNDKEYTYWKGIPERDIVRIPLKADLPESTFEVMAEIFTSGPVKYIARCTMTILPHKLNEVRTDALTGGVIVNGRIFFPFGFYCYSPVYPTLPEEEVVKGFNMISPYQKILPETFGERKAYMDRCAMLGLKVHYNLLSVSGGGGVSSRIEGISDGEKRDRLIKEIMAFRDHPALLAWYISDEPNGYRIPPEELEKIYKTVKEADPWHPVSVVFMAPFLSSRKYANGVDIVMADPYPVPNSPVSQVGKITAQLSSEFKGFKPVWIVPQAFGGGEWWGREPSIQELRSMTYQAIINGAKGIQYFIRHGLNSFPKSTAGWNECGRMALEISELSPWLLSDETGPPIRSYSQNISVSSYRHEGRSLILAVNTSNKPQRIDLIIGSGSGTADVLFENRKIGFTSGIISDLIQSYGSQAYLINENQAGNTVHPFSGNMMPDPGFEDLSNPGVPSSCYSWNEGDRGATFFLDTREHYEGYHSLRMVTPQDNLGTRLRFFPVNVQQGHTYVISIWAKADPGSGYSGIDNPVASGSVDSVRHFPYFEIGFAGLGYKRFRPNGDWNQFVTSVTIPADTLIRSRINVMLRMPGSGTGWFDLIQVFEATDILRSINPELDWDNNLE